MPDIQPPPGYTLDQTAAAGGGITPPPGYNLDAPPAGGGGTTPKPSFLDAMYENSAGNPIVNGMEQAAVGAGKGLMSTAYHGGDLIRRGWNAVAPQSMQASRPLQNPEVQAGITPNTPGEKFGYGAEQLGEYAAPGGLVADAAKGIQGTLGAIRGAKAINIAAKAGLEGASAAGVAGVQSGGDPAAMKRAGATAGLVSGAAGVVGAGADAIAPWLKDSAVRSYSRTLGPTTRENKLLTQRQVAPGLIERGVTAVTRKGLQNKIAATVEDVGQQVGDAIAALPADAALPEATVLKAVEDAANRQFTVARPGGGVVATSPDAAGGLGTVEQLKSVILAGRTLDANGNPVIDSRYLRELRQNWDAQVAAGKGFTTNDLVNNAKLAAYRAASGAIREEFAKAYPDINVVNKQFAFWKNAQKVMDATVQRTQSQATPMGEQIAQGAGAAAGIATHGAGGALGYAAGARMLVKLMRSPAWQTTSAVAKDRLANLVLSGNPDKIASFAAKLSGGVASGDANGPTPYAVGGVVNQPTDAIVGEKQPEVIVPLGGTVPEDPRTLSIQMGQLQNGQRRAVLFPKGTPIPDRPDGLKQVSVRDGMLYYQPGMVKPSELISASKQGRLNDVLGAADGGMGPQSKGDIAAAGQPPLAVIGKAADGTTAQGTLASPDQVSPAIEQTAKVTPPGGRIAVENPKQEILRRIRAGRRRR